MAMDTDTIPNLLSELRDSAPDDLQHYFLTFEDLWERKIWHELTTTLEEYFQLDGSRAHQIPLFNTFISSFAEKINQLKLVTLGLSASTQIKDDAKRLEFLERLQTMVDKPASQDAFVYAKSAVADSKTRKQDIEGARKELDEVQKILDTFDAVDNVVHAAFYRANSDYYQVQEDYGAHYRNSLLFLACVDLNKDLIAEERQQRAYNLSIAAIVSDTIYNFGELLLHPILDVLNTTQHAWLRELLFAFNRGDLQGYDALRPQISKIDILHKNETFLRQKISLAALTEAAFRRPPGDRAMTFSYIRDETKVQSDDIELLVMKAFALGLLKGKVDQVDEVVNVTWVQPKVLDMKQIEGMRGRLKEWESSVNQLGTWIEGVGKDVWAA